ncbi:uncharacterized protein LOC144472014 [Augochlora pura]
MHGPNYLEYVMKHSVAHDLTSRRSSTKTITVLAMACLYIDRLKCDFQRVHHHFGQRANNGEVWCPRSLIDRLCNYKCEHVPEVSSNVTVSVKFNPASPKIFAIGLHPDRRDTKNHYFSLINIKELLKRYLAYLVQRYRSYFYSSSKLACGKNCHQNMCTFSSFVSVVSKCSKEFAKNIWDTGKGLNHGTLQCKCCGAPYGRLHNAQAFSRNISDEHRQDCQSSRKRTCCCNRTMKDVNSKDGRSSSRNERIASPDQKNAFGDACRRHDDSPIYITKRSISVQTSRRSESRRKDRRKKRCGRSRKERSATNVSLPQNVETIFKANSEDFNLEESNLNLNQMESSRTKDACVAWRTKGKLRSNTSINEDRNSGEFSKAEFKRSEKNRNVTTIYPTCAKRDRSVATKIETILTNKFYNVELSETEIVTENGEIRESRAPPQARGDVFLANTVETRFQVEDKSSETIILGKIKKRLEEEYDDYFSFDECVMEDAFDVNEGFATPASPRIGWTSSDSTIDYHVTENMSDTSTRKMESFGRYWRPKYTEENSSARDASPRKSIQTNLKYSVSIHCTNSNLSHSQSSYYTPSPDQDGSQCSSMEYCSAGNYSSSNFSRANSNLNLLSTRCTRPSNTCATYNYPQDNASPLSIASTQDFLLQNDPILQSSGESLSEATLDLRLTRIRQRRSSSAKNASNLSKLVSESFDSGVLLSDRSNDHILSMKERSRRTRRPCNREERDWCATQLSLLPAYDFSSNSSYSDESLDRRLDVAVKQFTDNLVLTERKVRLKLRRLEKPSRSRQQRRRQPRRLQMQNQSDSSFNFYWSQDDDIIASSSTPPVFSLSDSEVDHI